MKIPPNLITHDLFDAKSALLERQKTLAEIGSGFAHSKLHQEPLLSSKVLAKAAITSGWEQAFVGTRPQNTTPVFDLDPQHRLGLLDTHGSLVEIGLNKGKLCAQMGFLAPTRNPQHILFGDIQPFDVFDLLTKPARSAHNEILTKRTEFSTSTPCLCLVSGGFTRTVVVRWGQGFEAVVFSCSLRFLLDESRQKQHFSMNPFQNETLKLAKALPQNLTVHLLFPPNPQRPLEKQSYSDLLFAPTPKMLVIFPTLHKRCKKEGNALWENMSMLEKMRFHLGKRLTQILPNPKGVCHLREANPQKGPA